METKLQMKNHVEADENKWSSEICVQEHEIKMEKVKNVSAD